jgi:leucyl-tRNA synthetase
MKDLGLLSFEEPFAALFNQGMITRMSPGGRVEKMSKSRGNAVSLDPLIAAKGADAVRAYVLFLGPPESDAEWSDDQIAGPERFLYRVIALVEGYLKAHGTEGLVPATPGSPAARKRHIAVRTLTHDFDTFSFHTAVAHLMEFSHHVAGLVGDAKADPGETRISILALLALLHPIAPHLTEELHERMGETKSLLVAGWPAFDPAFAVEESVTVAVQVSGKLRGQVVLQRGATREEALAAAEAQEAVAKWLEGKERVKVVFVPDRLLNVVVK